MHLPFIVIILGKYVFLYNGLRKTLVSFPLQNVPLHSGLIFHCYLGKYVVVFLVPRGLEKLKIVPVSNIPQLKECALVISHFTRLSLWQIDFPILLFSIYSYFSGSMNLTICNLEYFLFAVPDDVHTCTEWFIYWLKKGITIYILHAHFWVIYLSKTSLSFICCHCVYSMLWWDINFTSYRIWKKEISR